MKIRNGFVSNSSSSSFVIVGTTLDRTEENFKILCEKYCPEDTNFEDFEEKKCCDRIIKSKEKFCPTCGKSVDEIETTINWSDVFNEYSYDFDGLDVHQGEYDDDIVIGKSMRLDLEGDEVEINDFIKQLQESKEFVEKMNLGGKIKLHVGTSYN